MSRARIVSLLIGFTTCLPLIHHAIAQGLVVPADSGAAVDAIVVLGRDLELNQARIDTAAELWRAKRAPVIFVSAGGQARSIVERLEAIGIPNRVLDGENCSLTTAENALFTAAILHPQGIRQILLITDPPHMMRALLTFCNSGFAVIPHPSPLPQKWGFKTKTFLELRESLGLISYSLQSLLPQHEPLESTSLEKQLLQAAQRYGRHQVR